MESTYVIVWLLVAIGFFAIDIFTSAFLFVWFGLGALIAMIGAIFGIPLEIQIILFLVASLVSTSLGYPWARKRFKVNVKKTKTRDEEQIGTIGKAEKDIINEGEIKLDGVLWKAINTGDEIKKGDKYKILQFKGNKIMIEKVEEDL
ncbi:MULTISPECIES: NfeD family protein [Clostridium]|uniref:NfeD family protein n=1 Tax=Clostridium paridis TaxID=2803863 RepID=A0A937FIH7_9CLOT|nr:MULTISPECIES: NfeD family protein [Clostridium]MBL4932061.1 NfeD family protein [Clostridium paridis]